MGGVYDFERGQIVGTPSAGASVMNTAKLFDVSRATVCKIMSAYTNYGKTTPAKGNGGRKATQTERDRLTLRRIVS
jgi:transposase